jgi:ribonuclease BN (tRNA processing enzyme)
MTPREAGRLARISGVETLVLCHLGSPTDGESAMGEAAAEFGGDIRIAADERVFLL